MNQKTNFFGGVAAKGFFPATGANSSRDLIHKHILSINLKNFSHQFVPALISMTDRASEHIYLCSLRSP